MHNTFANNTTHKLVQSGVDALTVSTKPFYLLQELAGLREEVNTVTNNIKAELDQVIQQKNKEIAQLEVNMCMYSSPCTHTHALTHTQYVSNF